MQTLRSWFREGTPWIWLNAGALSIAILMVIGLLLLITVQGAKHFWPAEVWQFEYVEGDNSKVVLAGERADSERVDNAVVMDSSVPKTMRWFTRYLIKTGNRDLSGGDFRWVAQPAMGTVTTPAELAVIEREEWGNFYGYITGIRQQDTPVSVTGDLTSELEKRLDERRQLSSQIKRIEKTEIGAVNYRLEHLRLRERSLQLDGVTDSPELAEIARERDTLKAKYQQLTERLTTLRAQIERDSLVMRTAEGEEAEIKLAKIIRIYHPNRMSLLQKTGFYIEKIGEFISAEPRESNTEGGIFPAIFGTVLMVFLMTLLVTPFGVLAAIFLREYASQGWLTRLIRIAVNNLAGVPSVVYGVFGLGFFVYFLGGNIDRLFYPEALPAPTFGTPGILWSAVTLALLTVPVVIVATEEGLTRIPRALREGSLALGATPAETLRRVILPMAGPAIMTGLILAVARAAGEVAPLMLVGVVKLAPTLPLDGNFPFLHMDRKFMHLGFHIYDVGFQSPNVEAARPLVYATTLLLVIIVVALNLFAIRVRNRLRAKYSETQ